MISAKIGGVFENPPTQKVGPGSSIVVLTSSLNSFDGFCIYHAKEPTSYFNNNACCGKIALAALQ